ncbi:MAG: ParB N-terminal domain-containing protein [Clostridia bacterium]
MVQTIEELSASLKQKISDQPIEKIKLEETVSYSKHPFRVPENAALKALAKDIKEHGLLEPIIVRVLGFGGRYEILSGHRRAAAQKLNGAIEIEARVVKVSDIEAAPIVINSNFLQRDKILLSERAKSYMLRNECLKRRNMALSPTVGLRMLT